MSGKKKKQGPKSKSKPKNHKIKNSSTQYSQPEQAADQETTSIDDQSKQAADQETKSNDAQSKQTTVDYTFDRQKFNENKLRNDIKNPQNIENLTYDKDKKQITVESKSIQDLPVVFQYHCKTYIMQKQVNNKVIYQSV